MGVDRLAVDVDGPDGVTEQQELRGAALWRWRAVVALAHALILGPVVLNALFRPKLFPSLYLWHAARIETAFSSPLEPGEAHFLWAGTGKLVNAVIGASDVRIGAAIVTIAAYMFFGVCVFEVVRRLDDGPLRPALAAVASVVIALLETPAALAGWERIADPSTSFLALYMAFLPTSVASLGFNVLLVWFGSRLLVGELPRRARPWLPVLVVAAALAKPNLVAPLTAVVLGTALWARYAERPLFGTVLDRTSVGPVARLIVVPAVAVTIFQDYLLRFRNHEAIRGSWVVSPFTEMSDLGAFRVGFWLVLLLPLAALLVLRGRLLGDPAVWLPFGALALGIAASLLLARSNPNYQGDVLQLCQAATAMLIVFVPRRIITLFRTGQLRAVAAGVLLLALAPYVLAGAATWRCHSGLAECYPSLDPPEWPQPRIEGE